MYETINTMLACLISLGIMGTGVVWIIAGTNSALCIGIGIASITVGAVSLLKELRRRTH